MRGYTSESNTDFDVSSTGQFGSRDTLAFKVTDLNFNFIYKDSSGTYKTAPSWDTRMGFTGQSTTAGTDDDGKLPDFIEISISVVNKDILEKYNGSPPQSERKEFKIMIPFNQRSFRNE